MANNYFDSVANTGSLNGKTYHDYNEYLKDGGQGSGGGGGGGAMDSIRQAIELQKQAVQPAIQSYQASIPEVQAKYTQANQQLESTKQPLTDRYNNLLNQIKGNQTTSVNNQTRITNNELGKRGLTGDSTLAQQEIQNTTSPLNEQYSGMLKDATLNQDQALKGISDQQANLVTNQTGDLRAIQNAIAQLTSGAAQSGTSLGQSLYANQLQNALQQQQLQSQQAQQSFENSLQQKQSDIDTQLKQQQLSKAMTANNNPALSLEQELAGLLGTGNTNQSSSQDSSMQSQTPQGWQFIPEIGKYVTGYLPDGRAVYSDGTSGWSYGRK